MDNLSGHTIKGYELHEQLGAGGFGVVYRAYQPLVKRDVAIKVILPVYANNPDFIRRFEAEAQVIARLEHPYIVPLYDYWREPDGAYLVMRFFRGGNLRASIKQRTWSLDEVSRLLDQIGAALTVAHRHDIVHRDLKPDNILLDEEQNAYLADFGIAKDLTEPTAASIEADDDVIVGSPSYLSPEQIRTEGISPRTDQYSLGIVLYELLTGTIPFPGLTPTDTLFRHLTHPLPPLAEKRPDLPQAIDAIIQQATAKNPDERFPDAVSLAAAFRQAVKPDREPGQPVAEQLTTRLDIGQVIDSATMVVTEDLIAPENPYKGLRAFQEADSADFFGREALTQLLLGRLGKIDSDSAPRFLAVVGPSGSGKSSVVKAGVIPALRKGALPGSDRWFVVEMMPGTHPLEELEAALLRIAVNPPASLMTQLREDERGLVRAVKRILPGDTENTLLLVIDQFEEAFTMTADESERTHFLASLLAAANDPRSPVRVVVTLRADFYDRPLLYTDFGALMRQCTEVVLPMTNTELEQAIVRPAERVGLKLEAGLVQEIIADIGAQPGTLPLLQYALSELFERREGRTLKLNVYRESGGVMGALARRADELYNSLNENAQRTVRQLFLRLVTLGEGTEDTRRRVRHNELAVVNGDASAQGVIEAFGKYRLLTFDRDPATRVPTVEVAHEALIRQWGRLREWIDTSRDQLRIQRRLAAATEEWLHAGRDASFLASGARLDQFESWAGETDLALNEQEAEYLRASIAERERRRAEERARQEHEARLERRSRNFLRALVVVMALAALGALGLTGVALNQRGIAEENAVTATVAQGLAVVEANNARSLALVSGAQLALGSNDTELAVALALEANRIQTSVDAQRTLAQVAYAPGARKLFAGHTARVMGVAFSPNGAMGLSAARDDRVILWDVETGQEIRRLEGHEDWVWDAAFSPDGKTVMSASQDHTLILWDVATGEQIRRYQGHTDVVSSVVFNADGTQALSGSFDHTMILWNVATGQIIRRFEGDGGQIYSVALSKTGFTALSGNQDGSVTLWNVASGTPIRRFIGHTSTVWDVEYTPDELGALSASDDRDLLLWSFDSEQPIRRFVGHSARITDADFSPDGSLILSSAEDNTLILWNTALGSMVRRYGGQTGPMYGVSFSPDGKHFLSGGWDYNVRLWDVYNGAELRRFNGHNAPVYWVEYSADGSTLLTGGDDNSAILWDAQTGEQIRRFIGHEARVTSVAYSPDGATILTGSDDRTMKLWSIETGELIRTFDAHSNSVFCVTYSPDGKTALSGSTDNSIIWWDLETGEQLNRYIGHRWWVADVEFMSDGRSFISASFDFSMIRWDLETGNQLLVYNGHNDWVRSVVLSPDGAKLLSASADSTLILWDVQTGQRLRTYEGHGTQVQDVAFSPDGKLAISGSNDTTLILWDVETGAQLRRITGHEGVIRSVAFRPDGRAVLSGSGDGTVREWQLSLELDELIAWTRSNRYVRDFTCAEREYYAIPPLCSEPTPGVTPGRPA